MNRSIKRAAVLLTVLGMACLPGTAIADPGAGQIMIFGNSNQVAGADIFNSGHDNIVGSGDGTNPTPGLGAPVPSAEKLVILQSKSGPVTLEVSVGDAAFPNVVGAGSLVSFSGRSRAAYAGSGTDYDVSLSIDDRGDAVVSCQAIRGRCTVDLNGAVPVVIMSK